MESATAVNGPGASWMARAPRWLPTGRTLPETNWRARHAAILIVLAAHALILGAYAAVTVSPLHAVLEGGALLALALAAAAPFISRRARSSIAAAGLMSSSAVITHLSGGYIEAHFHFFVMIGLIALYEDWTPFLLGILYVAVHHGVVGTFDPTSVYNHPDAIANPWRWGLVHAAFIMALSAAVIVTWRLSETERSNALRSAERQRAITDTALDAIVTIDPAGSVIDYNPAAERIFGYARSEAVGREMAEIIIPAEYREMHRAGLRRIAATGEGRVLGKRQYLPALRKDGSTFPAELAIVAVGEGKDRLYTGYLRDLTDQQKAKELETHNLDLERTNRELKIANDSLESFSHLVGHDLKEPVRAMDFLHEEMRTAASTAEVHDLVERAQGMTRRLAKLLNNLLEISRVTHFSTGDIGPVDLGRMLQGEACTARSVDLYRERGAKLDVEIASGVLPVRTSEPHLCQAIGNLLVNAVKHNTSKTPHVLVRIKNGIPGEVELSIEDNGPGFPPDYQTRLGRPPSLHSGFGLLIVQRALAPLGARLEIGKSERLGGAQVKIHLPSALK